MCLPGFHIFWPSPFAVAIPPVKSRHDSRQPCKRRQRMVVLLASGFAFQCQTDDFGSRQKSGRGRTLRAKSADLESDHPAKSPPPSRQLHHCRTPGSEAILSPGMGASAVHPENTGSETRGVIHADLRKLPLPQHFVCSHMETRPHENPRSRLHVFLLHQARWRLDILPFRRSQGERQ